MNEPYPYNKRFVAVTIFAIAMAFLEAAVVEYLRQLYYPEGFSFPLKMIPMNIYFVELGREAATIIMLAAIGYLAGKNFLTRFSAFIIAFGVWDIFYYVFLKLILNWPSSLFDWDILFLIPLPWIGPVLAPVIISVLLIFAGYIVWWCDAHQKAIVLSISILPIKL